MSTRRGKAIFGLGLVVFGLAVFLFASAYLISRDQPKWLAAAVGALAFPVLPVLWHVIAERRRRQRLAGEKTPPKSTLAAGDRYAAKHAYALRATVKIGSAWRAMLVPKDGLPFLLTEKGKTTITAGRVVCEKGTTYQLTAP